MFQLTTEGASVIRDILEALGSIDSVKTQLTNFVDCSLRLEVSTRW